MPASHVIDQVARMVVSRAWGTLTDGDLVANRDAMVADPAFDPEMSQLWDFSAVDHLELTGQGVRGLAASRSPFMADARRALIVPDDATFGMARMFLLMRDRDGAGTFQLFRDRDAAVAWLTSPRE